MQNRPTTCPLAGLLVLKGVPSLLFVALAMSLSQSAVAQVPPTEPSAAEDGEASRNAVPPTEPPAEESTAPADGESTDVAVEVTKVSVPSEPPPPSAEDRAQPALKKAAQAQEAGDSQGAKKALEEALAIDPKNLDALYGLALWAMAHKEPTKAGGYLQTLLGLDPFHDDARVLLARAHWQSGQVAKAKESLDQVFDRHPEHRKGLALKAVMEGGSAAASESDMRPVARIALTGGYNSNLTLQNTDDAAVSAGDISAPVAGLELAAGVRKGDTQKGITVLGYLAGTQPLGDNAGSDDTALRDYTPTMAGVIVRGARPLGSLQGSFDIRHRELFNGAFEHQERLVAPSLAVAMAAGKAHTVRVNLSGDYRMPTDEALFQNYASLGLSVRDTMRMGRLMVIGQGHFKRRLSASSEQATPDNGLGTYNEAGAMVYGLYKLGDSLALFVTGTMQYRMFDGDESAVDPLSETVLGALGGVRYRLGKNLETQLDLSQISNLSNDVRTFSQQRVGIALRYWYP